MWDGWRDLVSFSLIYGKCFVRERGGRAGKMVARCWDKMEEEEGQRVGWSQDVDKRERWRRRRRGMARWSLHRKRGCWAHHGTVTFTLKNRTNGKSGCCYNFVERYFDKDESWKNLVFLWKQKSIECKIQKLASSWHVLGVQKSSSHEDQLKSHWP